MSNSRPNTVQTYRLKQSQIWLSMGYQLSRISRDVPYFGPNILNRAPINWSNTDWHNTWTNRTIRTSITDHTNNNLYIED